MRGCPVTPVSVHPTLRSLGLSDEQNRVVTERLDRDAVLSRRAYGGKPSTMRKIAERVLREAARRKNRSTTNPKKETQPVPTTTAYTPAELREKTLAELVDIHNERAVRKVKTFKDKETALRRTFRALGIGEGGRRVKPVNLKPGKEVTEPKDWTERFKVLAVLRQKGGATLAEVNEAAGEGKWSMGRARSAVMWLNKVNGWGVETDPTTGKMTLVK